jgi:hypothetical protein
MIEPLPLFVHRDLGEDQSADFVPFSDLHIGDRLFDRDKFVAYRDWVLAAPNRFCAINGDTFNAGIPGSKSCRSSEDLNMDQQMDLGIELLRPLVEADRLLFINDGNHDERVARATGGIRPGKTLAQALGRKDLFTGDGCLLKLTLGKGKNGKRLCYTIYHTHGWAAGRTPGAAINACRELQHTIQADCYVVGHSHKSICTPADYFVPDLHNHKVRTVKVMFVCTGSFLHWGGYAQAKGYSPSALGCPRIRLDGTRHDLHASV